MEEDDRAYFNFSFVLIKTWKGVKIWGESDLIYDIHPLSHPWTWNLFTSISCCWDIHFLWVIPSIWVIVLRWLVTLPVFHCDCFWLSLHYIYGLHWVNSSKSIHFSCLCVRGTSSYVNHLSFVDHSELSIPVSAVLNWSYFFTPSTFIYFMSIYGGYINSLIWYISSCLFHLIIQEVDQETSQYLRACRPSWQVYTCPIMGIPHWLSFGWFY